MRFDKFLVFFLKFRRTTNNVSSLINDKTKKNKRHRLRVKTQIDDKRNNMNKKKEYDIRN